MSAGIDFITEGPEEGKPEIKDKEKEGPILKGRCTSCCALGSIDMV